MKSITYRQCRLTKGQGDVREILVTWLPDRYTLVGMRLKLRDGAGNWVDGWIVESASSSSLDEKVVVNMSHAHTRQRRASDI